MKSLGMHLLTAHYGFMRPLACPIELCIVHDELLHSRSQTVTLAPV